MTERMIQNLENKMETLINRMVAHIKKYKKSLTRCLEESFHFHLRFKGFVNELSHLLYTDKQYLSENYPVYFNTLMLKEKKIAEESNST